MSFHVLLYRYFFFGWLFKDANKGSMLERAAAYRWNKEHAHWLWTYFRRWAFIMISFYILGAAAELLLQVPVIAAFFYVPSIISIAVNSVISVMIAWLKFMP